MTKSPLWIVRRPEVSKTFRLFCFPYAGGSAASFIQWQRAVHPQVSICAIQLPGRGERFHEAPYSCLSDLIAVLAREIHALDALPCAFLGHSLGGLLAFELARYQRRHGLPQPQHLFVSGCHAPQFQDLPSAFHSLDDDGLMERLRYYKGTPPDILAHRELMALLLPAIRADFSLAENYQYHADDLLSLPLTVFAGRDDAFCSMDQVYGWQRETTGPCSVQWFDGDHFFIRSRQQEVIDCVNAQLTMLLASSTAACA